MGAADQDQNFMDGYLPTDTCLYNFDAHLSNRWRERTKQDVIFEMKRYFEI